MPWSVTNPPSVAQNWTQSEKEKCVSAANAVLENGGTDKEAIFACIHAAGKSKEKNIMKEIIHKSFPVEIIKADVKQGIIEAIVAVIGNIDHGDDVIHPGAFTKTLSERGNKIRVLDNHNSNSVRDVIGKPVSIKELSVSELPPSIMLRYPDAKGGLYTVTQFDMDDEHSKTVFNKLANGFVDEWSIGFTVPKGKSDIEEKIINGTKKLVRNIREVVLFEYSPVIWAANSATATLDAKSEAEQKRQSLGKMFWNIIDAFENQYLDRENWTGFTVNDVFDDGTMIVCARNVETEFMYYQLNYHQMDNQYTFDPIENWLGGNYTFVAGMKNRLINLETKQGRVLSQRNFDKLTQAHELLMEVVNSAIPDNEEMTDDVDLETKQVDEQTESNDELAKSDNPLTIDRESSLKEIDDILVTIKTLGV